jgi:hypothetical protein
MTAHDDGRTWSAARADCVADDLVEMLIIEVPIPQDQTERRSSGGGRR